ncbi:N-acetylmuramoyl-L-alanine amidase [Desemzia sp. RIT804]|uniref:N-acetylmuramoyl-L-alanine amidase n=1 Tax=Desemzia sp. RIT 804 TaxID=2810209 RepID=UPI001951E1FA|nr:N-acetylmuramoyl-L-alanine amidase [Desemzia sp. RIT 804]MBM6615647.1 N-acetylmuramoyl-L-alanine amidase [Desemzia sp. RIT 804]
MVLLKKQIVSNALKSKVSFTGTNGRKFITVHQTGNTSVGANAQAHANIQTNGNPRAASWHYSVDGKQAIQSFEDTAQLWHCGDGRGNGNLNSIGIELCINADGIYKKTLENGAELVKQLMEKYNIPIENVRQHFNWSGKNCPAQIRANKDGIGWSDFLNMVKGQKVEPIQEAAKPVQTKPSTGSYTGNSVVDYLSSIGVDNSYTNRAKLAKEHGISNYSGTAAQNAELLKIMRNESTVEDVSRDNDTPDYKGASVVDYLNYLGKDSSFNNRKKLADQYGVKNYTGTASQNTALLNAMQKAGTTTSKPKSSYTGSSLVDYLKTINVDSSFANRKKLAAQYGVANYTGTAAQNSQLLNKMR